MHQYTPEEKYRCAGELSLSLKRKMKKRITSGFVITERKERTFPSSVMKRLYLLTSENPFLVRYWPRCLALPPKNFPSSLIQERHNGTPNRP